MKKNILGLLLVAALGASASTFTVSNSTNGTTTTFTITRSGEGTNAAETVYYRTVSRSGLAGVHFANAEGSINFTARQLSKTVPVEEFSASQFSGSNKLFLYYQSGGATGSSRTYRFEVVDAGGFPLAGVDRTISGDSSKAVSTSTFDLKSVSVIGGTAVTVTDNHYTQAYHAVPLDTYFSGLQREYLLLSGARLNMVFDLQAAEVEDGYQYIQVLADQTTSCDSGAGDGDPGTISLSRYMAGFEHKHGDKDANFEKYTFPLVSAGNNCGAQSTPWYDSSHDYNGIGNLCQQRFNLSQNARADDGRLSVPASINTLGIRFNASGSGGDDWQVKYVNAKIQAAPVPPMLLVNPVVSAAPACKGSTFTVSLVFSEIVTVYGAPTLQTTWGNIAYVAGSGANVLSFSGTITADAGTSLTISGLSGTVKGLTGTGFTWPRTIQMGRTVDVIADPPRDGGGPYLLSTSLHLRWFAERLSVNAQLSAALADDIDFLDTAGISAMGGSAGFHGVFDGRGHSISRLKITSPDPSGRMGLFGLVGAQGVVTNLAISNITVSCYAPPARIGAVCGINLGTIARCSVSGSMSTYDFNGSDGNGSALGGVCGENGGTVRACRVVGGSVLLNNYWANTSVGGVAGVNTVAGRLESCYFHSSYSDHSRTGITRGAVCGANAGTIRDCVGLHDDTNWFDGCVGSNTGTTNNVPFLGVGAPFSGGEACFDLNAGVVDGSQIWYQTIGEDALPQFSGETVYKHGSVYSNTNHIWGVAAFTPSPDFSNGVWSVVCSIGGETAALSATGTCAVTTQPACASPGDTTWTYLPPANDYGITATNAVQHDVPAALGHVWGVPGYSWAVDGSTATASNICTVCGETFVETVDAVCVVIREPTRTVPGEKSCTATFASPFFTEQTTVVAIPVLPPPVPYIDTNGVERLCESFTVLTNAVGDATYGTSGEEAWYIVTNDVSIGGTLQFNGSTNHLIVCDGASLAVANHGDAICAAGSLSIYGQADGTGSISATSTGGVAIYADSGNVTINGGVIMANSYGGGGGILTPYGSVAINGGSVTATCNSGDNNYGICAWGDITLGWRTPADSIYVSSYTDSGNIYIKPGQTLTDGTDLYTGGPIDPAAIAGKTLRPPMPTVPYIDADGEERRLFLYTVLTNAAGDVTYGTAGEEAWYVVTNDVSISGMLSFINSHAHLILCDGASLAVTNTSGDAIFASDVLSIYGQSGGTGVVTAVSKDHDGIRSFRGDIVINGGIVNAKGFYGIYPLYDITINGGRVNAVGSRHGISADHITLGWRTLSDSIYANIYGANKYISVKPGQTFTDGTDLYTGGPIDSYAIAGKTLRPYALPVPYIDENGEERQCFKYIVLTNAAGDVTYGTSGEEAWYVVTNNVSIGGTLYFNDFHAHLIVCDGATLAVTNTSGDAIHVDGSLSIYGQADGTGTLNLKGGQDGIEAQCLAVNGGRVNAIANDCGIFSWESITINGGRVNAVGDTGIDARDDIILGWRTLSDSIYANSYFGDIYVTPGLKLADGTTAYTGGPIDPAALAGKTLSPYLGTPVPYMDENGEERQCLTYTVITSAASGGAAYGTSGEEAWYVVTNDVSIGGMLWFTGTTNHLILCDGATLAVTNTSGDAIHVDGSLSIYGQADGTGSFDIKATYYGIEARSLAINGGCMNAAGGEYGISSWAGITINGGRVNAVGNREGISACEDVILGWRKPTDSIFASSYRGPVSVKPGQALTDGTDTYAGDSIDPDDIAGKTLRPVVPYIPYIDENGEERRCYSYTVITNAAEDATYGTSGEEAWYVVTNNVSIGGMLQFNGATNHLIVCDGATLAVTNTSDDAIHADGSLSIYGQADGTGTLDLEGYDDGIEAQGLIINGGIVNANGRYGFYSKHNLPLTVNGGVVNAIGLNYGIWAFGSVALGWRTPADSIYVSSYSGSDSRNIYIKPGQTLTDGTTAYTGGPLDNNALAGKTLSPYVGTPVPYMDENGKERLCLYYTVLTNAAGGVTYGTSGEEAWYVVTNEVSIGGTLQFNGSTNHLIVCDGATLAVTNMYGEAVYAAGSLSIYGQADGTGSISATGATAIYADSDNITINGGVIMANGGGGGGGILAPYGSVAINGGIVTATCHDNDNNYGIFAWDGITLGWTKPTDSIYATSYFAYGNVYVTPGLTFTDGTDLYTGRIPNANALAGKTLRPYVLPVPYIDENGEERQCFKYTVITNAAGGATYGTAGEEAWYVVTNDVSIGGTLYFNDSHSHLIVCDGATLAVTNMYDIAVYAYGSLYIYGQADGTGSISATGAVAIYADSDNITINGGVIMANGGGWGGVIIAPYGSVAINGGSVTATCDNNDVNYGIYAIRGIILGWTKPTDSIYATGYVGNVYVKPGHTLTDGTDTYSGGPLDTNDIAGKTLYARWPAHTYTVHFDANGGDGLMPDQTFTYDVQQALTSNAFTRTGYTFVGWRGGDGSIYPDGATVSNLFVRQASLPEDAWKLFDRMPWPGTSNGDYLPGGGALQNKDADNDVNLYTGFENVAWKPEDPDTAALISGNAVWFDDHDARNGVSMKLIEDFPNFYFPSFYIEQVDGTQDAVVKLTAIWQPPVPIPYIDADGNEQMCTIYTVLTNAIGDVAYGELGVENWYVVTNDVTISGRLYFGDYHAHLIVCDGATLTVTNENGNAIDAYGLAIYCQTNATGAVVATGSDSGIHGDFVTINGGSVTATGGVHGICAHVVTINGGNVAATGVVYGIYPLYDLTINGGNVNATGGGIYAESGFTTLGWTNLTDSIYASRYYGRVRVKSGQALTDGYGGIYEGDIQDKDSIAGKTLRPYVSTPTFKDPQGYEIQDSGVVAWLSNNGFTQADINSLGDDAAATKKLYECFMLNSDFTAQGAGGALSITGIAVTNGFVSITVQLERKAPLGFIIGHLYLYGASDLAAGFDYYPIADESIDFGTGDPTFATVPAAGTVTQSVTATFSVNAVAETFFKAAIEPIKSYEPEPEPELEE